MFYNLRVAELLGSSSAMGSIVRGRNRPFYHRIFRIIPRLPCIAPLIKLLVPFSNFMMLSPASLFLLVRPLIVDGSPSPSPSPPTASVLVLRPRCTGIGVGTRSLSPSSNWPLNTAGATVEFSLLCLLFLFLDKSRLSLFSNCSCWSVLTYWTSPVFYFFRFFTFFYAHVWLLLMQSRVLCFLPEHVLRCYLL